MRVLVTGATGFIGSWLMDTLRKNAKFTVTGGCRVLPTNCKDSSFQSYGDLESGDFTSILNGQSVVIHAAARVHLMSDNSEDPLMAYRSVNVNGTLNLANQAAAAGIKRFIFISSIKVNGETTKTDQPFTAFDDHNASDPYSISKSEAERALLNLALESGMEVVIIRPPLVYGPGVKANFASLLKFAKLNLPLPLGAIHNKRSMVALENLIDLICVCIEHPKAKNQVFLVSDDHDLSTTQLLQIMTRAYGKKPRLIPIPMKLVQLIGDLIGRSEVVSRLCGSLQVDIEHTKHTLGWAPPISVERGVQSCIRVDKPC